MLTCWYVAADAPAAWWRRLPITLTAGCLDALGLPGPALRIRGHRADAAAILLANHRLCAPWLYRLGAAESARALLDEAEAVCGALEDALDHYLDVTTSVWPQVGPVASRVELVDAVAWMDTRIRLHDYVFTGTARSAALARRVRRVMARMADT